MSGSFIATVGSIVTCRDRQWVVLPSDNPDIIRLRPLSGNEDQICGIYRPLQLGDLNLDQIESAQFPLPKAEAIQDHAAAQLLMDAARLSLRSGAGPFRCLGRLSVRPRPYQLVPLLMALRLETVRLLVADDVGIGKTIEAGLIARELLDRGEVKEPLWVHSKYRHRQAVASRLAATDAIGLGSIKLCAPVALFAYGD